MGKHFLNLFNELFKQISLSLFSLGSKYNDWNNQNEDISPN